MPLPLQNFINAQTVVNANWLNQVDLATRPITGLPAGNLSIAAPTSGDTLTLNNFLGANAVTINYSQQPGAGFAMLVNSSSATGDVRGVQVSNTAIAGTNGCFGFGVGNDTNSTFFMGKNNSGSVNRFNGAPSGDCAWLLSGGSCPIAFVTGVFGALQAQMLITAGSPGNVRTLGPFGSNGAVPPAQSTGWGTPVGGAVVASYNITDAGGANSNTNKALAQVIAYLKLKGDFGA